MALRVYTRQSAPARGGALYTVLTRRLREAGAAGITTVRGEWGFSSDERPFGDRFGTIGSHAPTYTIFVDRPRRIAELWPIVDEITAEHGVVTAVLVPAYRERAEQIVRGRLTVRSTREIAELYRTHAAPRLAYGPAMATAVPAEPVTPEDEWARTLVTEIAEFAAAHNRPCPLVRVTLADGEQFFLASLAARPGDGFVTLHPHPERADDLAVGADGALMVPRTVIVPLVSIRKVELLTRVPRGTRSTVGFSLPPDARAPRAGGSSSADSAS
jgi:PII-like signaling protein